MSQIAFSAALALMAFLAAHIFVYPRFFPDPVGEVTAYSLEETVSELKRELGELSDIPGSTLNLHLGEIKIELTTQEDRSDSSKTVLSVPVFDSATLSSEGKNTLTEGSKVTIILDPPKEKIVLSGGEKEELDLSSLVLSARRALLDTLNEPPVMMPKRIGFELNFVLVKSQTRAGKIEAKVIEIGGGSQSVRKSTNKLSLNFERPEAKTKKKPVPPGG